MPREKTHDEHRKNTGTSKEKYCRLLDEKIHLLSDYWNATQDVKESLVRKNGKALNKDILYRKRLIKQIDRLDNTIRSVNSGKNVKCDYDGKLNDGITVREEKVENLLNRISAMDAVCMNDMELVKDKIKKEIIGFRQKRNRATGYRSKGPLAAKFIDTRIR
jgi:hypothetical protein